jgi:hypothetical protein
MPNQTSTAAPPDRRQRFREFMRRFNPTVSAKAAIGDGLICQHAGRSIFKKLAAGADLTFGSQQLLVGGIGSGKTTELMLAHRELSSNNQMLPLYIDVSAETDLSTVNSGALLASLGMHAWRVAASNFDPPEALSEVYSALRKAAYGYQEEVWFPEPDYDPREDYDSNEDYHEAGTYRTIKHSGKLRPPYPALRRDVNDLCDLVAKLTAFLEGKGMELVAVFDGLDRLIKADQFWSVVEQDLRAIRRLEVSVLATGPLSIMYGQGRQIKDYFDEVHYLAPAVADPRVSPFLLEVLRVRGAGELMQPDQMQRLCLASGGVLRDLISLARSAGENAYMEDADNIEARHVARSIEQLGNSYLLGLGTSQKVILENILRGKGFTPSNVESMELLITRRVLEQSESEYEVHPALLTVLPQTPNGSE